MLRGIIVIYADFAKDFNELKAFCDENDIQIYRLDLASCSVVGKPMRMYKLMQFVEKHGRRVINIELVD